MPGIKKPNESSFDKDFMLLFENVSIYCDCHIGIFSLNNMHLTTVAKKINKKQLHFFHEKRGWRKN